MVEAASLAGPEPPGGGTTGGGTTGSDHDSAGNTAGRDDVDAHSTEAASNG